MAKKTRDEYNKIMTEIREALKIISHSVGDEEEKRKISNKEYKEAASRLYSLIFQVILDYDDYYNEDKDKSTFDQIDFKGIKTKSPKAWVTPVDKVSNLAFDGEGSLYHPDKLIGVEISNRKSKKEILSMVSLNFDDDAVEIKGKRELTPYDREVHDAAVTLFVDGKNEYLTPRMIYRAMTGNAEAPLNPKQKEAITNSLSKLMYSRLIIKASEDECKAYGFDKFTYEGTVLQAEKATATINGNVAEVYHLLKEPVLYSYAAKKNQIGRLDIKLLNSPVNKNEENIALQSYLYRRILAIKKSRKLSPTIVYDTVYKQIDVHAKSDGALRKKKVKVRGTVKKILDYWIQEGFIKGYVENSVKNKIISINIQY